MQHFEGDKELPRSAADVWAKLSDARFLAECIPGAEAKTEAEADRAVCKVRPGFAFVRGTLEVTLQVAERVADKSLKLLVHSKGIGSSSDVEVSLALTPADNATQVHWRADVTHLGGLLKAVPTGLIRGAAQQVIADVWANIEAKV